MAIADLADPSEVSAWRWEAPAGVLHRFEEHGSHGLGPAATMACSIAPAHAAEKRSSSAVSSGENAERNRFVFATCCVPGTSGSNADLIAGRPVIDRAPIVVPWYASVRAITLWRCGCPIALKYAAPASTRTRPLRILRS